MTKILSNMNMTKELATFNTAIAALGGILYASLGGYSKLLEILLLMMLADYITGFINGVVAKELSSKTGIAGIGKKIGMLFGVAIAALVAGVLGQPIVRELVILWIISNEGVSLCENYAKLGLPLPEFLKDSLVQLKHKSEKMIDAVISGEEKKEGI